MITTAPGLRAALAARGVDMDALVGGMTSVRMEGSATDTDDCVIPSTAAELENMLGDSARMQKVFKTRGKFGEFVTAYARTVLNKEQDIATQVRESAQREIRNWLKEHGEPQRPDIRPAVGPGPAATLSTNRVYNSRAMGAAIDSEVSNSADFFRLIWHNSPRDAQAQARLSRIRNAFSTNVPSEGGMLIPEVLRAELLRVSLETSIVRPRARVIPMESMRVPFPAIDSTSNASSVYGGIIGYWTEEGGQLTSSAGSFGRVLLDAKKLTAYTEVPNELISDSAISFQAYLDQIFPEALGFYEDYAFLRGSGVGEPLGVMNADAMISVTKQANQDPDTIVWENIVKMFARMLPGSLGRAVWVASIDTFPELASMALSVGTGGSAIWLNNGQVGPPMSILGRPVVFTEKCPVVGDAGDINFIDFGFYLVGDRQVMSATSSPHFKFQNDQTAFRVIERVDGKPWLPHAITPKNGGASLSPYVRIEARA